MQEQRIGNYRVLRTLGEGGMGVVYEGIRDDIGVRAAIKVLRPEYAQNNDAATRFFNEARAANLIAHPSIVKVFDYGPLPNGSAYLAMEYLDGESLRQRLDREKRLSEADAMRIARQIAAALAAAHGKQVIHRDLKPENVMVVPDAEMANGERVKVLDFGIAKLVATPGIKTRPNILLGTPIYMSPEQCRGLLTVDDRADVYALGVMLFEMVAGRPPFVGEDPGAFIAMHVYKEPPSLRSLMPDVEPGLNQLVMGMLVKEPAQRPAMGAVTEALKRLGHLQSDVLIVRRDSADLEATQALSSSSMNQRQGAAAQQAMRRGRTAPEPVPAPASAPAPAPPVVRDDPDATHVELGMPPMPAGRPGARPAMAAPVAKSSPNPSSVPTARPSGRSAGAPAPVTTPLLAPDDHTEIMDSREAKPLSPLQRFQPLQLGPAKRGPLSEPGGRTKPNGWFVLVLLVVLAGVLATVILLAGRD